MSSYARTERQTLAELFLEEGPDAPTLCEGWTTADLAAHLVIRERRPDAAIGIVLKPMAGHAERVQRGVRDGRPWPKLVETVRTGPPFPFRLHRIDEAMNTAEYFIHVEDVRRARAGWEPRQLGPGLERALWSRIGFMARGLRKSSPVGVTVRAPDHGEVVARPGEPHVTMIGPPGELVMFLAGRQDAAQVELEGEPAAVAKLRETKLGI